MKAKWMFIVFSSIALFLTLGILLAGRVSQAQQVTPATRTCRDCTGSGVGGKCIVVHYDACTTCDQYPEGCLCVNDCTL